MDFVTINPGPVVVRINKIEYAIPRMLLPSMAVWMDENVEKQIKRATAHLNDDDKARFLMYFAPPLFDVTDVASDVRTPAGVERLLRRQLPLADPPVPPEVIKDLIEFCDTRMLRALAEKIMSAANAEAIITQKTGGSGDQQDPLAERRQESAGSQSTGSKSKHESSPPTSESAKSS